MNQGKRGPVPTTCIECGQPTLAFGRCIVHFRALRTQQPVEYERLRILTRAGRTRDIEQQRKAIAADRRGHWEYEGREESLSSKIRAGEKL